MTTPSPTPPRHPALALALLLPPALLLALLSAAICGRPAHALLERQRIAQWPLVDATIVTGRASQTHFPATRNRIGTTAWCANWDYHYAWQGAHHVARISDDAPSPFAPGCFVYEAGARDALARRAPGSVVKVRVDPARPDESTPDPKGFATGDALELVAGLVPMAVALWMILRTLRLARELRAARKQG